MSAATKQVFLGTPRLGSITIPIPQFRETRSRLALPKPGEGLRRLLAEHGALVVEGAEAFTQPFDWSGLEKRSRQVAAQLSARVCATLFTPLDSEDLRTLASQFHRLIRLQWRMSLEGSALAARGTHVPREPIIQVSSASARLLAQAVALLPGTETVVATQAVRNATREGKRLLREWKGFLLATEPAERVLAAELFRSVPVALFEQYAATARYMERTRFKNG